MNRILKNIKANEVGANQMGRSSKTNKTRKSSSQRSNHWQDLPRDKNGRWMKKRKKKSTITSKKKPLNTPQLTSTLSDQLEKKETPRNSLCPRCGGDMRRHRIRCGPERLVSVKKCEICNYWIPLSETATEKVMVTS